MTFNDESVNTIFDKIVSYALGTGRFDSVNQHEPKNSPGTGMSCSAWIQSVKPVRSSGLASTSGLVTINARIYTSFRSQPFDAIDPAVTSAVADLMNVLSGDFDFGGDADVRAIDLLGSTGTPLQAIAGYVEIARTMYRVMTLTIPVIVNDMFTQEA